MKNSALVNSLVNLGKVLGELHELDWFHQLGNTVDYKKKEYVDMVKEQVDHAIGGLSILYLFAVFESYFEPKLWETYIKPDDLKLLRAYRHIRHCVAHGHHGQRVIPKYKANEVEYDAFDEVIRNNLFYPKNIIELDSSSNNITIESSAGIFLKQFMKQIVQYATAFAASN